MNALKFSEAEPVAPFDNDRLLFTMSDLKEDVASFKIHGLKEGSEGETEFSIQKKGESKFISHNDERMRVESLDWGPASDTSVVLLIDSEFMNGERKPLNY